MGGVGIQQFFILVFSFFATKFHQTILQQVRQGVAGVSRALPLLYALYAVLILITVHQLIPLQAQTLTFCEDENYFPSLRICPGVPKHHPRPRGVPILPRLSTNAVYPCHTQFFSSRSHHARGRKQSSYSQTEKSGGHS
jgi:hypothetical protein